MSSSNEIVVVVGASGAFGGAIVGRLLAENRRVLGVGRDPARLDRLSSEHGDNLEVCAVDLAEDAAIEALSGAIGSRAVRAVVHGPGVPVAGGILTAPTEAVLEAVNIKVGGLLRLARAADRRFVEGSRIIAIGGHYGLEPVAYAATAGVANAALFAAVRQLSLAYGPRGITAHSLAPGPADTPRLRRVAEDRAQLHGTTPEAVLDQMRAASSIGQLTTPEQVAWAVSMLLAPEATVMNGSTLMLEAGRRRGLP